MRPAQRGTALLEYVGIVLAVILVGTALVSLRSFESPRRPPIDPIPRLRALVTSPPPPRATPRPTGVPPRRRPPRPRPPRPPRPVVEAPGWALGP